LKNNADVTVVVTDLAGKTVSSAALTNATAGKNKVDINTASMAAGVYTVNFVANNTMITKKLVVRK
jgi:CRISPR/Cas system CSM-associated protein Csm3 (group 7 of RAMP superfamily)